MLSLPSFYRPVHTRRLAGRSGFTLVELLVAMGVLALILLMTSSFVNGVSKAMKQGSAQLQRLSQAQRAYDLMRRTLSEATLHPYFDYVDSGGNTRPAGLEVSNSGWRAAGYQRESELRFIAGPATGAGMLGVVSPNTATGATIVSHAMFFQVPTGHTTSSIDIPLRSLLNTVGFYVEYGLRTDLSPNLNSAPASADKRFRLMMMIEPAENLTIYSYTSPTPLNTLARSYAGNTWYVTPTRVRAYSHLLAENVIAFAVRPKQASTATTWTYFAYPYNTAPVNITANQGATQHQLPPVVEVTMVALDPDGATRLERQTGSNSVAQLGLATLFNNSADPNFGNDLTNLTNKLTAYKVPYRTFVTDVTMEGSQWN